MKRRLFNVAAGLSLLLCIVAGMMLVRGHLRMDTLIWTTQPRITPAGPSAQAYAALSRFCALELRYEYLTSTGRSPPPIGGTLPGFAQPPGFFFESQPASYPWSFQGYGFQAVRYVDSTPEFIDYEYVLRIPWWEIFVTMLLATSLSAIPLRNRRRLDSRRRAGLCENCGYDLRATPKRCPECGAVPSATKVIAGSED